MKNIHHHISSLCLVLLSLLASLTACSDKECSDIVDGVVDNGAKRFQLCINISVPNFPGSRATYEQGVGDYENAINLEGRDYKVLLFSADNGSQSKLLFDLDPSTFTLTPSMPDVNNYRTYTLRAEVGEDVTAYTNMKVVMLANWGDYPTLIPGTTTIDDLAGYSSALGVKSDPSTTYMASNQLTSGAGKYIPMFGIKDCANLSWVDQVLTWAGDLWLLRAVAKIEVRTAENCPRLTEVKLSGYNALGTCAPKLVYSEADYVIDTDKYKELDHLTLPGDKNDPSPYTILPDADGVYTVYVPEYQILADPLNPIGDKVSDFARLNVKFQGIDNVFDIDFKYYTESAAEDNDAQVGDFFDIKRNYYYYRYTLNLKDPANLDMEVIVIPYIETILNPNFGLLPEDPDKTKGFAPVYSKFEDILYYTDGKDYLAPDKQTPITDPTKNLDDTTGWQKIEGTVEGRNVLYFYYDPVNKIQYAPDRKTKIRTVFSFTEVGYLAYLELNDEEKLTGADNYHDAWHDLWYDLPPTKGYYVDKTKTGTGIGYVYDTNSNLVINTRTGKSVQFISVEKSIEVGEDGKKYLLDTDGKRVQIKFNNNNEDVVLKIILLENPYPAPAQ